MTQEGIYSKGKKLLEKQAQPSLKKIKPVATPVPSSLVENQMDIRAQEQELRFKREAQQQIVGSIAESLRKELPGVDEGLRSQVASVLAAVETLKRKLAELKSPNWQLEHEVLEKLKAKLDE